ncbi:MAG: hypothetical protein Q8N85_02485 [Candidatus Omnitrophota bacterium]|nr:hypothetical protein [Candidatus Omnitrophota bacterium]
MKKSVILAGGLIVFTAGLIIFSLYQSRRIEREAVVGVPLATTEEPPRRRELIPADPRDYGMVVFNESSRPRSQDEWDRVLSQKIREMKERCPKEVWDKAWEKKKEDPQKTAEKLQKIEAEIKKCNQILAQDPGNQEMQEKLEHLTMLKSIARELNP